MFIILAHSMAAFAATVAEAMDVFGLLAM